MTKKEIKIEACDDAVLHWVKDVWAPLVSGKEITMCEDGTLQWTDSKEYLPLSTLLSVLYAIYNSLFYCPYCPLTKIKDCYITCNTSYHSFIENPTTENAVKMILSIIKAKKFVEENE